MAGGQQGDGRQAAIPGFDERILQLWTRIVRRRIRFRRLTLIWAHLGQYIRQCRRRGRERMVPSSIPTAGRRPL